MNHGITWINWFNDFIVIVTIVSLEARNYGLNTRMNVPRSKLWLILHQFICYFWISAQSTQRQFDLVSGYAIYYWHSVSSSIHWPHKHISKKKNCFLLFISVLIGVNSNIYEAKCIRIRVDLNDLYIDKIFFGAWTYEIWEAKSGDDINCCHTIPSVQLQNLSTYVINYFLSDNLMRSLRRKQKHQLKSHCGPP